VAWLTATGVPATVITRLMLPDDVNGAAAVGTAALEVLYPAELGPPAPYLPNGAYL
jgi:hypothetical protein